MRRYLAVLMCLAALVAVATACSPAEPPESAPPPTAPGDPTGSSLAPGLYPLPDGTVQAIGTLEYRDLEGGFWAVIDRSAAAGAEGTVVAVIANADEFPAETGSLEGLGVIVAGTQLQGASIRMAGPEVEASSITSSGAPGPAE